jgi:hypothetical protein
VTSPRKSPRGRHTICCFGRRTLQVSGFQLTLWNPVSTLSLLNPSSRLLPVLDRVPSPALLSPSLGFGDLVVHPLKVSQSLLPLPCSFFPHPLFSVTARSNLTLSSPALKGAAVPLRLRLVSDSFHLPVLLSPPTSRSLSQQLCRLQWPCHDQKSHLTEGRNRQS